MRCRVTAAYYLQSILTGLRVCVQVVYDDLGEQYREYGTLVLHTPVGDIRIALLPALAPYVVRELRREVAMMAATGGTW